MKSYKGIIWGLFLILLGVIIGLNSFEIIDVNLFFKGWWTLFIIVPGFINLFDKGDKTGNIICILIGVLLLLGCQGILSFENFWKIIVPAILVIIGLSIVFKNCFGNKINKKIKMLNSKGTDNVYYATFSGQNLNFDNEDFAGANLTAVFGGIELNLVNAKINSDVVINVCGIFGGIDIFVPNDVNVKVKSTSIFGGVDNKKKTNDGKYTVYVNATCLFGGVDIK